MAASFKYKAAIMMIKKMLFVSVRRSYFVANLLNDVA